MVFQVINYVNTVIVSETAIKRVKTEDTDWANKKAKLCLY